MFQFIFICLTFSAGIPVLYPIVAIFFQSTYYFDLITIAKYYKKTNVFDEELPIQSLRLFKYAIILHLLFLILIVTKSEICRVDDFKGKNFENIETKIDYIANLQSGPIIAVYCYIAFLCLFYVYKQFFEDPFVYLAKIWIERLRRINKKFKKEK